MSRSQRTRLSAAVSAKCFANPACGENHARQGRFGGGGLLNGTGNNETKRREDELAICRRLGRARLVRVLATPATENARAAFGALPSGGHT